MGYRVNLSRTECTFIERSTRTAAHRNTDATLCGELRRQFVTSIFFCTQCTWGVGKPDLDIGQMAGELYDEIAFGTFRHLSVPFSNLWPHIMRVYTSARHRYKIEQKDKNTHMVMNHHLPCVFFDFYDRCSCAPAHRLVEVLHVTFRVCRRTHYLVTWRGIEPMRHQNRSIRSVALGMRYLNSPDLIELGRGRNPTYI